MTEPTNLARDLQALATGLTGRSQTAIVREHFDHIERALQAGVKRAVVLDKLREYGIHITQGTFNAIIHTLRKERQTKAAPPRPASPRRAHTETDAGHANPAHPVGKYFPSEGRTSGEDFLKQLHQDTQERT